MKSPTLPGKTACAYRYFHTGLFDDEPESFRKMDLFLKENHLIRKGHTHREIYLKDMSRTAPEKMKTILRYMVSEGQKKL